VMMTHWIDILPEKRSKCKLVYLGQTSESRINLNDSPSYQKLYHSSSFNQRFYTGGKIRSG